mmetsp:Transcript_9222/g.27775  ORF Transcript_9222/g.27775 Transcript_9222/m.27775 type:complete len:272 (+) Transcript_9222:2702-3517(+)
MHPPRGNVAAVAASTSGGDAHPHKVPLDLAYLFRRGPGPLPLLLLGGYTPLHFPWEGARRRQHRLQKIRHIRRGRRSEYATMRGCAFHTSSAAEPPGVVSNAGGGWKGGRLWGERTFPRRLQLWRRNVREMIIFVAVGQPRCVAPIESGQKISVVASAALSVALVVAVPQMVVHSRAHGGNGHLSAINFDSILFCCVVPAVLVAIEVEFLRSVAQDAGWGRILLFRSNFTIKFRRTPDSIVDTGSSPTYRSGCTGDEFDRKCTRPRRRLNH